MSRDRWSDTWIKYLKRKEIWAMQDISNEFIILEPREHGDKEDERKLKMVKTVREIINDLLFYDPSLKIDFVKLRDTGSNESLRFVEVERSSEEYLTICFDGDD